MTIRTTIAEFTYKVVQRGRYWAARGALARGGDGSRRPHRLGGELIVNLTSYPPRYRTLALTLRSLLAQSIAADRTILWIAHDDLATLPSSVRRLESAGLEIRACDDLRSFKKLVPALETFPRAFHVTADDDLYYPRDWLARLTGTYLAEAPAIVACRAHMARVGEDGRLLDYRLWEYATAATHEQNREGRLFPVGVGGVLYPPGSLAPEATERALLTRLCPHNDDVWFFWMGERKGTRRVRVRGELTLINWPTSQRVNLYEDNMMRGRIDKEIDAVESYLGPLGEPSPVREVDDEQGASRPARESSTQLSPSATMGTWLGVGSPANSTR